MSNLGESFKKDYQARFNYPWTCYSNKHVCLVISDFFCSMTK